MDVQEVFRGYEQRKNLGKIVGERKYQSKANKDVEKKLTSLSKKINDLQQQRRFAYKNSIKVKKAVHNQINQIVKCFRARERHLLFDVDEAFIAQDSSIDEELSKLLSTYVRCQTLYANIEDFKEHLDVITKISSILSPINLNEKSTFKPLELLSNFEQMKAEAATYGCVDGDFVKKDNQSCAQDVAGCSSVLLPERHLDSVVYEQHLASFAEDFQKSNSDVPQNLQGKLPKRERCESGDSFEIVDLLEHIHCQEDRDSPMGERGSSPEVIKVCTVREASDPHNMPESLENSCEVSKNVKFPDIERRIMEMQQRLENLVTSTPKCNPSQEKKLNPTVEYPEGKFMVIEEKTLQDPENQVWLLKSPRRIDILDMDKKLKSNCSKNVTHSPADLVKKAFSPYFANENVKSWLLSKN